MTLYDRETYECKDCGHLVDKSRYKHYKSRKGFCKIIGIRHSKDIYGSNRHMESMISDKKVHRYETERIEDNRGRMGWAYRIGRFVWNVRDLEIVNEDGSEYDPIPVPEPAQFDTNTLFL